MKTIKSLTGAMMAIIAMAFCAASAKASLPFPGLTTNYSPLTVSMIVTTNGPAVTNMSTSTITYVVGKTTLNNTFLLNVFSHWAGMTWPTGAKLEVSWDLNGGTNDGDVVVTDKTGTNALFDASDTGTNAFFRFNYNVDLGASYIKGVYKNPGSFTYTLYNDGYFEFYDDNVYLTNTDLYVFGGATVTFTQNWNAQGVDSTWTDKVGITGENNANMESFLGISQATVSGTLTANGNGKGTNSHFYSP